MSLSKDEVRSRAIILRSEAKDLGGGCSFGNGNGNGLGLGTVGLQPTTYNLLTGGWAVAFLSRRKGGTR